MLVHGFAWSAFTRIVLGLHVTERTAALVDNFVIIESVLLGNASR